jgi:hypothetical protein
MVQVAVLAREIIMYLQSCAAETHMRTGLANLEFPADPLCAECQENCAVRVVDEF